MADDEEFPNRALQLEMLRRLKEAYPNPVNVQLWKDPGLAANLHYLHEHELANVIFSARISAEAKPLQAKLTAKGVDFLQQDGGLSAILGVVTIKLHDDTIKSLIEARIMQSDLPQPDKHRYLDALRDLPAESTKHLVMRLVDMGLDQGAQAISAIGTLLGQG